MDLKALGARFIYLIFLFIYFINLVIYLFLLCIFFGLISFVPAQSHQSRERLDSYSDKENSEGLDFLLLLLLKNDQHVRLGTQLALAWTLAPSWMIRWSAWIHFVIFRIWVASNRWGKEAEHQPQVSICIQVGIPKNPSKYRKAVCVGIWRHQLPTS